MLGLLLGIGFKRVGGIIFALIASAGGAILALERLGLLRVPWRRFRAILLNRNLLEDSKSLPDFLLSNIAFNSAFIAAFTVGSLYT